MIGEAVPAAILAPPVVLRKNFPMHGAADAVAW